MSASFFTLATLVAMTAGVVIGAYVVSTYWQRELHHVRRSAERDLQDERRGSSYWYASASDLERKLITAYDLITVLQIPERRIPDLNVDRTSAIGSSTTKKP